MMQQQLFEVLQRIAEHASPGVAGDAAGLDYAKAISELSQGQLQLQASQQSFASVSKLSLFNYIS